MRWMRDIRRDWINDFFESLKDRPAAWYMISLMRLNSRSLKLMVDTLYFLNRD
jgi:hypothetical protein